MSRNTEEFKEQYKYNPIRVNAVSQFKKANKYSVSQDVRKYMCQVMATIGLEIEDRFSDFVSFNDDGFKLFGREKSKKSTTAKKKDNIRNYDEQFASAIESGNTEDLPTEVRPIFDFYAFKLVCPEIKQPNLLLDAILADILSNIEEQFPDKKEQTVKLRGINTLNPMVIDYIESNFSDSYPGIRNRFLNILNELKCVNRINEFLDKTSLDVSSLTYSEYYPKIIECYQILIHLSYKESTEEYDRIAESGNKARDEFQKTLDEGKGNNKISAEDYDDLAKKLEVLLQHISHKKTNKLDLALCDLMVYDILSNSNQLKKLGVSYSKDPTRTKSKRNPNGYIANFYSLDMPNGLTSEIQLQSAYRYEYGEHGPAAHDKMDGGRKRRKLYKRPTNKKKYSKWAKKQFRALPRYFNYRGTGHVEVYNTLQNFSRYYDCKDDSKVQTYVHYIAKHDYKQLYGKHFAFSLDDDSSLSMENDNSR